MKTRRLGSSAGCPARHERRSSATSARSCSAACAVFFNRDVLPAEEVPQPASATLHLPLRVQPDGDLFQGEVRRLLDQRQQPVRMGIQFGAMRRAHRIRLNAARLPPTADETDRRTDADLINRCRHPARNAAIHRIDNTLPKIFRISHALTPFAIQSQENQSDDEKETSVESHFSENALEQFSANWIRSCDPSSWFNCSFLKNSGMFKEDML